MIAFCVNLDANTASRTLIEAIGAASMGLVAHIDGQANAAKRGVTVEADQILEVFHPDFAIRVWQAEKCAGIDIPLRIHIYAADGSTHIAMRSARTVFAPYGNPGLNKIADELQPIFDNILACLNPYRETI